MTSATDPGVTAGSEANARHQKAWYWYDFANSAYVTTTATVLFAPYLTSIAKAAACPDLVDGVDCTTNLQVLGIPVSPGSLALYTATFSTLVSAVVLIFVGALADRSPRPTRFFAAFAWTGSAAATSMFFLGGTNWQLGVLLLIVANLCLGSSLVIYDALLCRISTPDERDRVSSRGWALGYLGGGLLLGLNFMLLRLADTVGLSEGAAVRISLLTAGLWWAAFTVIPVLGLRDIHGVPLPLTGRQAGVVGVAGVVGDSLRQLRGTFGELRLYPQTLTFLLAYLFYNDGIQTVIYASSLYGVEELKFEQGTVLGVFLLVQFVAFGGALLFGRLARGFGAKRVVRASLLVWLLVVVLAFFVPAKAFTAFLALGVLIGIVLGGSQALSRSLFSQLIPRGREAEFFSLYQAMERGTSWFGTFLFGLVHQLTHSYRWSIIALVIFFVAGWLLLSKVRMREGILAAGNQVPAVV